MPTAKLTHMPIALSKATKPSEFLAQLLTKFELVLNLKTARA
jgi:hypothetical protein